MKALEIKVDEDKVSVLLEGDLTASVAPELKAALGEALGSGALRVEFDLGKTTIIDSTGIGLLIATYNSVTSKGGSVQVVKASEDIFRLLQSMRLEKRLGVSKR